MSLVLCPCCGLPTLPSRGNYEICPICWWEDDGQDDHNADQILGVPNSHYSLTRARSNVRDHGDMYDPGHGIAVLLQPSEARRLLMEHVQRLWEGTIAFREDQLRQLVDAQRESYR